MATRRTAKPRLRELTTEEQAAAARHNWTCRYVYDIHTRTWGYKILGLGKTSSEAAQRFVFDHAKQNDLLCMKALGLVIHG